MPELPEVETVRRGLEQTVLGRQIVELSVTGRRSVRRQTPGELAEAVEGRRVAAVRRRGKWLALELDDGRVLVIHLRMSGQLLHVADPSMPALPHTHVVARLDDGSELRFVDPRTFGEWYVTDQVSPDGLPVDFERFGPDPLLDGLPARTLRARLDGRRSPVKAALTDQRVLSGVGNLYADEACFVAGIRPDRRCDTLDDDEVGALAAAVRRILREAIRLRGSSLRDARYRDLMGDVGGYQAHHRVYDRAGEPCPRCGASVVKLSIGARSAYCCVACQY